MRASVSTVDFRPLPHASVPAQIHPLPGLDKRRAAQGPHRGEPFSAVNPARAHAAPTEISFGPFRLLPRLFLLLEGDKPLSLGGRALEILTVLLERPGELVSKGELMARVWPNIYVEPSNLKVNISALRRVLRDGEDGNRFIINIPGRGYSFVSPVERSA
jgi:DNA-binding winged helix-turn-helix (wHTH) protein